MTIETTSYAQSTTIPQARPEQLERLAARRRFNRLYVYVPLAVITLLWLGLILTLLWLAVVGRWFAMDTNQEYYRALASGLADAFTILMLTPFLLLCALPSAAAIAFTVYRRQRKGDPATVQKSLPLFWRVENMVLTIQAKVEAFMPKLAQPIITAHAAAAFVRTLLQEIKEIITGR